MEDFLSSLVSDIKNYSGNDPLRPWMQGIKKMKESLPPLVLREKLPRFLQKCAQAFESDRRYRNDSRYVRVWIQLMDYVDDARVILKKMEKNQIGLKRAMFYSAYALYYEKHKKFEKAETMYCLGVENLAEPADELQKSYEQFLHRMKLLKERKTKLQKVMYSSGRCRLSSQQEKSIMTEDGGLEKGEASQHTSSAHTNSMQGGSDSKTEFHKDERNTATHVDKHVPHNGDDTVVARFVGSAIEGKSETEDACHHGLVDPTVNMKEAMNAISNMFKEPLELGPAIRKPHQSRPRVNQQSNVIEVFVDEGSEEEVQPETKLMDPRLPKQQTEIRSQQPFVGAFKIWTEEEEDDDYENDDDKHGEGGDTEVQEHVEVVKPIFSTLKPSTTQFNINGSEHVRMNGDTIMRRFVGSTVFDDPEVENACHHGLVDPTINLKEAMDNINSMFGEPINFVRASRPKMQTKSIEQKQPSQGFSILADDDLEEEDSRGQASKSIPSKLDTGDDLFEPTIFTKEAMSDINELFGKPLEF